MKRTISLLSLLFFASACDVSVMAAPADIGGHTAALSPDSPYYQPGSDLTVVNDSSYDFYELAIARVGDPVWSDNLLGSDPLYPGEELIIQSLACGEYDVLIVDHTDTVCVLEGFSLCYGDNLTTWVTDYDLAGANCSPLN